MNTSAGKTRSGAVLAMLTLSVWLLAIADIAAQDSESLEIESSIGIDITNHYFYRGILQENQGVILQPGADFLIPLSQSETTSWSLNVGTWNSLHDGPSGTGGGFRTVHYEFDAYAGIGVDFADNWSGSVSYISLHSRNSAFDTVQEINFSLSFDDSDPDTTDPESSAGVQPSMTLAWEWDGQSDGGDDDKGIYLELGIEPSLEYEYSEGENIAVSFPVAVGYSLKDYFEDAAGSDDTFGFAQVGVALSTPLDSIPESMGSWTLHGGVNAMLLGHNLKAINGGNNSEVIAYVGIGIAF